VRSPVNIIPRYASYLVGEFVEGFGGRLLPIWIQDAITKYNMSKSYADLKQFGIITPHPTEGVLEGIVHKHSPPMIDVGTIDLIRKKEILTVTSEIKKLTRDGVIYQDEKEESFDVIIFATGYHKNSSALKFLDESISKKVIDPETSFVMLSGQESQQENLYLMGSKDMYGRLKEIYLEAFRIARHIAQKNVNPVAK